MIPKLIHQYWDRPVPPDDVAACIQTWRDHHPGWSHILWNDESAASFIHSQFGLEAARCFIASTIPAMRSDILSVSALLAFGGAYADADTSSLRPLDQLLKGSPDCVLYKLTKGGREIIRLGLMLAAPRHQFMQLFFDHILSNIANRVSEDLWGVTGPGALTALWDELPEEQLKSVRLIDHKEAYRYHHNERNLEYRNVDHWSKQQLRKPILDFGRAADLDRAARKATRRARAGSGYPEKQ